MSSILKILFLLILVGGGYYYYYMPKYGTNDKAPSFSADLLDGSSFSLEELNGRYVLLDFWGSWCPPCRRENRSIVELYRRFGSSSLGKESLEIVSVGVETNNSRWKNAIKEDGLDWKYHIYQGERFTSPIVSAYGVRQIPTKYLILPDGTVGLSNPSIEELEDYLSKVFTK